MLLAIDTSTSLAGLALYDGAVQAELLWVAGRNHSVQLLPQVHRLLELVGRDAGAIKAVAAARGPGSFTGLRVGLATAQGLGLALGVPTYGVCSLDILAAGQQASNLPVRPLLDAGRGRFATALYERENGVLRRASEIISVELDELERIVRAPCLICGDLDGAAREKVRARLGGRAMVASPAASTRRPGVLAELAWQQHQEGRPREASLLEPLYLSR
jgi:tRNA threonylcarbamoyladenosine biosynthesis protein TsaB